MKFKGAKAGLGLLLGSALLLGACTSPEVADTASSAGANSSGAAASGDPCLQDVGIKSTKDGEIRFSVGPGDWNGYNNSLSGTNTTYNSVINAHLRSGFAYFGTDGTICRNKSFGTFELKSENPMVVEYTISDSAVWSDGTPVTVNDVLIYWASQNPEFLVPGLANGKDPNAKPVFDASGNAFAQYVPEGPQGEVNGKKFTITFSSPYPDYQLIVDDAYPAHVVAKQSGLEPAALAKAILDRDAETVKKAAKFWNTGWSFNPGELPDASLIPSSGPYMVKPGGWQPGNSLTLTANPKYWGTPAGTRDLVFRFIDDAQMVQSLGNGDVNVIRPQATVDTIGQLKNLGSAVKVDSHDSMTWEHLDYNMRESNPFGNKEYGHKLREAFAYCVPRQQIVDTLIKPISETAQVMNAREVFPFQQNYQDVVKASYDGRYDQVNIDKAKELIKEAGVQTPIKVRIGYRSGNSRRAETVNAIQSSCKAAGFEVVDTNSADFFKNALVNGDYDIALFAFSGSGQIVSGQNIYATGKGQNYGKYSSPVVDEAWKKMTSTLDKNVHLEQTKILEKTLWDDLVNIPLYAFPEVEAYDAKIQNVRSTATQSQVSWNAFQWVVS